MEMSKNNDQTIAECLLMCSVTYNYEISQPLAKMWVNGLKNYSAIAIEQAFNSHIFSASESGKYMPKPADILLILNPKSTEKQEALVVWARLQDIEKQRHYCKSGATTADDKIQYVKIEVEKLGSAAEFALRAIGGINAIAASTETGSEWLEKRFLSHFEAKTASAKALEGAKSIHREVISQFPRVGLG